jgi:hypothetical protein
MRIIRKDILLYNIQPNTDGRNFERCSFFQFPKENYRKGKFSRALWACPEPLR